MARALRIEFEEVFYNITARGNVRRPHPERQVALCLLIFSK